MPKKNRSSGSENSKLTSTALPPLSAAFSFVFSFFCLLSPFLPLAALPLTSSSSSLLLLLSSSSASPYILMSSSESDDDEEDEEDEPVVAMVEEGWVRACMGRCKGGQRCGWILASPPPLPIPLSSALPSSSSLAGRFLPLAPLASFCFMMRPCLCTCGGGWKHEWGDKKTGEYPNQGFHSNAAGIAHKRIAASSTFCPRRRHHRAQPTLTPWPSIHPTGQAACWALQELGSKRRHPHGKAVNLSGPEQSPSPPSLNHNV